MKKIYEVPVLNVMQIQTERFIATSGIDTANNVAGLSNNYAEEGVSAGGRSNSIWDDEEEY